jgi:serine/threonine protein kinase
VHKEELQSKYEVIEFIASGSFGKVYKVRQHHSSDVFALKIIEKSKVSVEYQK